MRESGVYEHAALILAKWVENTDEVVGWRMNELISRRMQRATLGSCPPQPQDDFIASVRTHAKYLATDAIERNDPPKLPKECWRRGFWMRFRPLVKNQDQQQWYVDWFNEGARSNLFTPI